MHDFELIIQTRKQRRLYELLSVHALEDDFPQTFVQDYAHWLKVKTDFVEWWSLLNAWTSTSQNWQMQFDSQEKELLIRDSSKLIDLHTLTAKTVSTILTSLKHAIHINITLNCKTEVLKMHLSQLKLDFFLRKDVTHLESKQFRRMIVNANQSLDTLIELINKLVLRENNDSLRSVIISHDDVLFKSEKPHVRVHIDISTKHVSYYLYHIDCQIERLVDNDSLKSKLFKC